jgi:transketolase
VGGLGSIVAELMVEGGIHGKLVKLGLQDTFAHGASRSYLAREYRIDAMALVEEVQRLVGRPSLVEAQDLAAVRVEIALSSAKAEAM